MGEVSHAEGESSGRDIDPWEAKDRTGRDANAGPWRWAWPPSASQPVRAARTSWPCAWASGMPRRAAAALMAAMFTVPAPGGPPQPQAKRDPAANTPAIAIPTLILDMMN